MTPLDVAQDDQRWARHLHWLSHFQVARDRTQALLAPAKWPALDAVPPADDPFIDLLPAPRELPLERRMLVLGWTWPARDFNDPDVFTTEICSAPKSSCAGAALAQSMSEIVGGELLNRMLRIADVTGRTFDQVFRHVTSEQLRATLGESEPSVVLSPSIGVDHLELLLAGQAPVDLQTLIEVSEDLHLAFGAQGWRIENPKALAIKIRRSQLAADAALLVQQMSLAEAEETVALANLRGGHGDVEAASVDPEAFNRSLTTPPALKGSRGPDTKYRTPPPEGNPMRVLYCELEEHPGLTVELRVADIDQWVREASPAPDAKRDRRRAVGGGLPNQAFGSPSWWANGYSRGRTHVRAWQAAGFQVQQAPSLVDGEVEEVTFVEMPGRSEWHRVRHQIRENTYRRPSANAHPLAASELLNRFQFAWQTRAALVPGALAGEDFDFAWMDILMRSADRNVRLTTNPP